MEIETIDKLNHVTLRRQKEVLTTLKPVAKDEETKEDSIAKTEEAQAQALIETGLTDVEMSVDQLEANLSVVE